MKLEEVFKASFLDFQRDFEPDEKQKDAFIEGFKYGMNGIISYIIDNAKGGNQDG